MRRVRGRMEVPWRQAKLHETPKQAFARKIKEEFDAANYVSEYPMTA